jgi:hypothetical protein
MFLKLVIVLFNLNLIGCAIAPHTKTVLIESSPPGAVIEMDTTYLGKAPISVEVVRKRNEWSGRIVGLEVTGMLNGCKLTRTIKKDAFTPDKIYFDFSGCSKEGSK